MAPEQAMGVTPLDRRADIYSLTAVTYAMLTGHPPFLVRSIADILARTLPSPRCRSRNGSALRQHSME
jgi:eukaryotic-like serine/threonine-protein kinase